MEDIKPRSFAELQQEMDEKVAYYRKIYYQPFESHKLVIEYDDKLRYARNILRDAEAMEVVHTMMELYDISEDEAVIKYINFSLEIWKRELIKSVL